MARIIIALIVLWSIALTDVPTFAQFGGRDRGKPIFQPLKMLRDRAETGVLKDAKEKVCADCKLQGKLFPKAACKRCERAKKEAEEEKKDEKAEATELKKMEAEAKKAELEAKKLEEEDKERNKPWDVADKENEDLDSPLLALAAKAKQQQDLAPKKQEALDYLASLGCNKDPNVEEAILAGLKDFNAEVRKAAVETVLIAVRGRLPEEVVYDPYSGSPVSYGAPVSGQYGRRGRALPPLDGPPNEDCPVCDLVKQKEAAKKLRKQQRGQWRSKVCGRCQGYGCGSCSQGIVYEQSCGGSCGQPYYGGEVVETPCQSCMGGMGATGTDGCKSCCSKAIRKELELIAFEPDPIRENCYYEPSIEVRNLALEALNLCPKVAEQEDDPDPEPDEEPATEKGSDDGDEPATEKGSDDSELDLDGPKSDDDPESDDDPDSGDNSDDPDADGEDAGDSDTGEDNASPPEPDDGTLIWLDRKGKSAKAQKPRRQNFRSASHQRTVQADPNLVNARVARFYNEGYLIEHNPELLIPEGRELYLKGSGNSALVVRVAASQAGAVLVRPVHGNLSTRSPNIQMGIMR